VKYKPSHLGTLPHVLRLLTTTPFPPQVFETISKMQRVVIGGAVLSRRLEEEFNAKVDAASKGNRIVRICQVWGMTEVGWVSSFLRSFDMKGFGWGLQDKFVNRGCMGRVIPLLEAKVVSEDGVELGPDEMGELAFRGLFCMRGYYKNPSATKK
jgi:acyl-coenzyme A synthetase/AMP-(fatty) acid ligase